MRVPVAKIQMNSPCDVFTQGLKIFDIPRDKWNMAHLFIDSTNIDKWARNYERDRFYWSMSAWGDTRLDFESKEYVKSPWEDAEYKRAIEVVYNPETYEVEFYVY